MYAFIKKNLLLIGVVACLYPLPQFGITSSI